MPSAIGSTGLRKTIDCGVDESERTMALTLASVTVVRGEALFSPAFESVRASGPDQDIFDGSPPPTSTMEVCVRTSTQISILKDVGLESDVKIAKIRHYDQRRHI